MLNLAHVLIQNQVTLNSMKKITSPYICVKQSSIHSKGIFAKTAISKDTHIIEYVGEKITKRQSEIRAEMVINNHKDNIEQGAVYIFELNSRYDIDGNVPYNTARFINHSCAPNCEAINIRGHIWIVAIRDIEKGEELTYNYGYGWDNYEDHICRCMADNCVGYILANEYWPRLRKKKR